MEHACHSGRRSAFLEGARLRAQCALLSPRGRHHELCMRLRRAAPPRPTTHAARSRAAVFPVRPANPYTHARRDHLERGSRTSPVHRSSYAPVTSGPAFIARQPDSDVLWAVAKLDTLLCACPKEANAVTIHEI